MPAIFNALLPVIFMIACGYLAGKLKWVSEQGLKDISKLAFNLLGPALLFRTLSKVQLAELDLSPVMMYHSLTLVWLTFWVMVYGLTQRGCMRALAGTYSNAVMIGIPLVSLAYGPQGLVYILTLVSVHALIILTYATVLFEWAGARDSHKAHGGERQSMQTTAWKAAKAAVLHPVSLPAFAGLLFAQTGFQLPELIDKPLDWLGRSFSPMALIMAGIQLQQVLGKGLPWRSTGKDASGANWREVTHMVLLKNLLHPVLILAGGWMLELPVLPFTVMLVTACMPVGVNSFMFATRYQVAEAEVSLSLSLSVVFAMITVPMMLALQQSIMGW